MTTYVYKAYDRHGHKRAGTIQVPTQLAARAKLRDLGLQTYFLDTLNAVRTHSRQRRKRQRLLIISGALLIGGSFLASGLIVAHASREKPIDVTEYQKAGILDGKAGDVVAKSPEESMFAKDMYEAWQNFAPGLLDGMEVHKHFMTIYVTRQVRKTDRETLETLATSSVKALQRRFNTAGATVIIVRGTTTLMEVKYNAFTKATDLKSYY